MLSMTLQLKISKTKKRLSDDSFHIPCVVLIFIGLMWILSFTMRATSLSWHFGVVKAKIPIVSVPVEDPFYTQKGGYERVIDNSTTMIVLSQQGLHFGTTEAFTEGYSEIRNKFMTPHVSGRPNIRPFVKQLHTWLRERKSYNRVAIIYAEAQWPMAIVIQLMQSLKVAGLFDNVILAGAML